MNSNDEKRQTHGTNPRDLHCFGKRINGPDQCASEKDGEDKDKVMLREYKN
jgi:hypothetical protein